MTGEKHSDRSTVNEESDHTVGDDHHARCAHPVVEASSVVLHVSNDTNEGKKDGESASETTATEETGEISKKTWKSEDSLRRSTPIEEKQRLKEVSKCIKNVSETKKRMKRQQDSQRILEDFKGVRNIPGIKSAKKKVLVTKIKNEKREIITSREGIANVFGEFYKKIRRQARRI